MTILALEFSSDRRSVALSRDGEVLSEAVQHTDTRATNALGLVETVLATANVAREEIEVIATGLGPGSYTGIRAAIALAQGWQLARGIKLVGINSAECLAAQAQAEGIYGRVNVVIDAQRGEFYTATWEISAAERRQILPLMIVSRGEIESRTGEICLGPQSERALFPAAAMVARLANTQNGLVNGEALEPIYLREASFVKAAPSRAL
jgi:tRNA threonylcarbamoyl adenosine modification protein YeaZ